MTRSRRSRSPTTRSTASTPRCSRRIRSVPTQWPDGSARGRSGTTPSRRTSASPSAASSSLASDGKAARKGCIPTWRRRRSSSISRHPRPAESGATAGTRCAGAMSSAIERFEIRVDESVLEDLRNRLARTRFPDQIEDTGWEYGVPVDYVRSLVQYWRDTYDWRAQEARLNQLAHFRTRIDGESIRFVHAHSAHAKALPLLIMHGWPGSIVEFLDVIPRLAGPEAHGGSAADAFHVIAPSLPGYGFSEPTRSRGWDVRRIARAFIELMHRLGYARYGVQGGDWGAQIATRIGALDPEHCVAVHVN